MWDVAKQQLWLQGRLWLLYNRVTSS